MSYVLRKGNNKLITKLKFLACSKLKAFADDKRDINL